MLCVCVCVHSLCDLYFSDNHVVVGELLESKSSQQAHMKTPKSMAGEISGNSDSEASQATGGYTIGFSMTVLQVVI